MTPWLFLSLWRHRWGKAIPASAPGAPHGVPFPTIDRPSEWLVWRLPGLPESMLVGYAVCVLFLAPMRWGQAEQAILVTPMLLLAIWARGHEGMSASLVLCTLAVFSSTRYLAWRFGAIWEMADGWDFRVALALWTLETGCVLGLFTQWLAKHFPLRSDPAPLPQNAQEWPRVGVFVVCAAASAEEIARTLHSADALDWPRHLRTLYAIDTGGDEDRVHAWGALPIPVVWISPAADATCTLDHLHNALWQTKDDIALVLRAGQTVAPEALQRGIGWFTQRPLLGVVATPGHGILPPTLPPAPVQQNAASHPPECLLLRRSHWLACASLTERGQAQHPVTAMFREGIDIDWLLAASPSGEWVCTPIQPATRRWRALVGATQRFFAPWLVVGIPLAATVPLWYFLAGIDPLPGNTPMLIAVALPHALFGAWLLHDRAVPSWWNAMRDTLLALHLLLLTAISTPLRRWLMRRWCKAEHLEEDIAKDLWKPRHAVLAIAHFATLAIASYRFSMGSGIDLHDGSGNANAMMLYVLWSAAVWVLLMARWAVCAEMEEIRLHTLRRQCLQAMLRSPQRRTIACQTLNFPQLPLRIATPIDIPWQTEEEIIVSIFCDRDECAVPAKVLAVADSRREITVELADRAEFDHFVPLALARTPDWPEWLPDRDADNLLPEWLMQGWRRWPLKWLLFLRRSPRRSPT